MSKEFLRTSDLAKAVGAHPNSVRLYEEWGYLPPIPRSASGYRMFTETHLAQMQLAWLALKGPYPGGKQVVLDLVHSAASGDLGHALELAYDYLAQIHAEQAQAEAALAYLERWAAGAPQESIPAPLRIGQVAKLLDLTSHMLRNWERDGLLRAPRHPHNGYRLYSSEEIGRLRVIRTLRKAGYTTLAILRAVQVLDAGERTGLREALETSSLDDEIYYIADRWLTTLGEQEQRAQDILAQIEKMLLGRGDAS